SGCPLSSSALRDFHGAGDFKPKTRAAARTIFRADVPAPALDGNLTKIEPQAGLAGAVFSFCKDSEEAIGGGRFRKTGTLVIHKSEQAVNLVFDAHGDAGALGSVAKRVLKEIAEDTLDARRVSGDFPLAGDIEARIELQADAAFLVGRRHLFDHALR